MDTNFSAAIIEYLSDEFHLERDQFTPDTDFNIDLKLNPEETQELLVRMQDALNFVLPEDKVSQISTLGDLLDIIEKDDLPDPQNPDYDTGE